MPNFIALCSLHAKASHVCIVVGSTGAPGIFQEAITVCFPTPSIRFAVFSTTDVGQGYTSKSMRPRPW
jgi:hypothetical protein